LHCARAGVAHVEIGDDLALLLHVECVDACKLGGAMTRGYTSRSSELRATAVTVDVKLVKKDCTLMSLSRVLQ
jgi:hypothetical protein